MSKSITCMYKGQTYRHQQFWALVRALNADGWRIDIEVRDTYSVSLWHGHGWRGFVGIDAPTPFAALAAAVAKLPEAER